MTESNAELGHLEELCRLVRFFILESSNSAGSGHPSSSLSAVELMVCLFFGGVLRFDLDHPKAPQNDRVIFSKGHASPLFYALYAAAGRISPAELATFRRFDSQLEGHPTPAFPYTEAATGSLGQGLSIGLGMALNAKSLDALPARTFVLLGDSEMSEGSQWEAVQLAAHYKLDNLVGLLDVNRLGQRGQTMYGRDLEAYQRRLEAFGWQTFPVDGHSLPDIAEAYRQALQVHGQPAMILAGTVKGKGVSFIEDKNGWHGKALTGQDYQAAMQEIGPVDTTMQGTILPPKEAKPAEAATDPSAAWPVFEQAVATRKAYGQALSTLCAHRPEVVALDAEVSNSTHAAEVGQRFPERFFEMYIAEQNMVGTALGLSLRGKVPFISTFAAFMTRAFDQLRMGQYSGGNLKCVGSHAGVSIGEDGASQMGLEDLGMFRSLFGSVVLYPCDGTSTVKLVQEAARHQGLVYLRMTRSATPLIYGPEETFPIGGSKVLHSSQDDRFTVCAAGITLPEALEAHQELAAEGIPIRVIDLYSVKPIDRLTLEQAGRETRGILVVEDHYPEGGLGEAVASAVAERPVPVHSLAVTRLPHSGKPAELLDEQGISSRSIVARVKELLAS
jgi:transketolase